VEPQLIVWLASFTIALLANAMVSSAVRGAVLAAAASVAIPWLLLLYVGHPVAGVTIQKIARGALASTAALFAVRLVIQRRSRRET
jgi:hypothetical protein